MKIVPKLVLSGGPCGGKTQGIEFLYDKLTELGFDVFLIRESAELLLASGADRTNAFDFQKNIAINQLKLEDEAEKQAQNAENPVIICDRGLMDAKVYLSDEDFKKFKEQLNLSDIELRDRYDAVFHMDSAGKSDYYVLNGVRNESSHEAQDLNALSLKAWCGNPHYRFIPVCKIFQKKLDILLREVKAFLGVPKPLEIERKFLIKYPDLDYLLSLCCVKTEIEQAYLIKDGKRFRVRCRGIDGNYIYVKTEKYKISETVSEEVESRISREMYNDYIETSQLIGLINKDRYCLMYKGTYYEIDIFPFWKKQAYLEVELLKENDPVVIPDFVEVLEEVTFKPEYKNISLCRSIPKEKIQKF